jgi:hypothetical protein
MLHPHCGYVSRIASHGSSSGAALRTPTLSGFSPFCKSSNAGAAFFFHLFILALFHRFQSAEVGF